MKREADEPGATGAGGGAAPGERDTARRQFLQSCGLGLLHFIVLGGFSEPAEAQAEYCNQHPATDNCTCGGDKAKLDSCECDSDRGQVDVCDCGAEGQDVDWCKCTQDRDIAKLADVCKTNDTTGNVDYCTCTSDEAEKTHDYCDCSDDTAGADLCTVRNTDDNANYDLCNQSGGGQAAADFCVCDEDKLAVADKCSDWKADETVDWCKCRSDSQDEAGFQADVCECNTEGQEVDYCTCPDQPKGGPAYDSCTPGKGVPQAVDYTGPDDCEDTEEKPDYCPDPGYKDVDFCQCSDDYNDGKDVCQPPPPGDFPGDNRDECKIGDGEYGPCADTCSCRREADADVCSCGSDTNYKNDYCACCTEQKPAVDVCKCPTDLAPTNPYQGTDPNDTLDWCRCSMDRGVADTCACGKDQPDINGWEADYCFCDADQGEADCTKKT